MRGSSLGSKNGGLDAQSKGHSTQSIGGYITIIHEAIRQGVLYVPVMLEPKEARDAVSKESHEPSHMDSLNDPFTEPTAEIFTQLAL